MLITLLNQSNHVITVSRLLTPSSSPRWIKTQLTGAEVLGSINAAQAQNVQVNGPWSNHFLFESLDPTRLQPISNSSKGCLTNPTSVAVPITLAFNASWRLLDVSIDCPWRMYCSRVRWARYPSLYRTHPPTRRQGIILKF
jgi:1-phosphatidylinositol phosphodiesterase